MITMRCADQIVPAVSYSRRLALIPLIFGFWRSVMLNVKLIDLFSQTIEEP